MEIDYSENALTDLAYWKEIGSSTVKARISRLIEAIGQSPFKGI